jgi:DNA-binding MarR family transcriptional regulator
MASDVQGERRSATALYSVENYSIEESVGYLLAQVRGRLNSAIDAEMADHDVTSAQWGVLLMIGNQRGETAAELCRNIGCDTGSMTRMLDRLEQKGLVRRLRSNDDRRVVKIDLTQSGRALYRKLPPVAVKVLNHHLRGFTREELAALKGFLRRMLANADR